MSFTNDNDSDNYATDKDRVGNNKRIYTKR